MVRSSAATAFSTTEASSQPTSKITRKPNIFGIALKNKPMAVPKEPIKAALHSVISYCM